MANGKVCCCFCIRFQPVRIIEFLTENAAGNIIRDLIITVKYVTMHYWPCQLQDSASVLIILQIKNPVMCLD